MPKPFKYLHPLTETQSLSQIIVWVCGLTLVIVGIGTVFALYKNWEVRVDTSKVQLIRDAEMVNMLVENALVVAAKSLQSTKREIEKSLYKGSVTPKQAYVTLMESLSGLNEYNRSDSLGMMFWVNEHGVLIARSGIYNSNTLDVSDRYYFQELRDHPGQVRAIGPLIVSRNSGQQVFHMSVPIYDSKGTFTGVLVQELLENDIAKLLSKYVDASDFAQIFTQFNGNPVSFAYPLLLEPSPDLKNFQPDWLGHIANASEPKGTAIAVLPKTGGSSATLVGYAKSPVYGLVSYATFPMNALLKRFLLENMLLFLYVLVALLFVIGIFYQVHKMSLALANAQSNALHDPLTKLNNRRALDERLPMLLRESLRTRSPISVLFIDIDFFRKFNENFGHESGDMALVAVAHALESCCKRPLDLLCRWGGEEFVAVLPHTSERSAEKIALDMLNAIRSVHINIASAQQPQITVSIGCVTSIVTAKNKKDDLVDMADKAMLHAKAHGRNQHKVFTTGVDMHAGIHTLLLNES